MSAVFVAQAGTGKFKRQEKCRETKPAHIYGAECQMEKIDKCSTEQSCPEKLGGTKVVLVKFSYSMTNTL